MRNSGLAPLPITAAAVVCHSVDALKLEQLLQRVRLLRHHPFLLQPDAQLRDLLAQALVLLADLLQREVVLPPLPGARDRRGRTALHFRERAERHRLEHRHAALGIHLGGYQDDVPDRDCHEQPAGTLSNVEQSHGLGSNASVSHSHEPRSRGDAAQ